jgi:leucyl/phenylalanyl-tRNA---protein transferase
MPSPELADVNGLVGVGADLEPGTLLAAYRNGLFPMPVGRRRIGWFSPDPRGIIPVDRLRVTRSMRQSARRYNIRVDTTFRAVMEACGRPERPQGWITPAFVDAYCRLHELGWAHSIEVLDEHGGLVGGLYGVKLGALFAGESMFHDRRDASKVALMALVELMLGSGMSLLDVQWTTPHLRSLGALDVSRREYLERLAAALR